MESVDQLQRENILPASVGEVEEISRFVNSAYRGDFSKLGWTTEADLLGGQRTDPDSLREIVADTDSSFLLLREGERLLACVHLEKKSSDLAYLGMLTVDPRRQSTGIGRRLLEAAESYVQKSWKTLSIEMTVIAQREELISWYLRRGYFLTGERRPFPHDNPKFGLPKRGDLEFVVLAKRLV